MKSKLKIFLVEWAVSKILLIVCVVLIIPSLSSAYTLQTLTSSCSSVGHVYNVRVRLEPAASPFGVAHLFSNLEVARLGVVSAFDWYDIKATCTNLNSDGLSIIVATEKSNVPAYTGLIEMRDFNEVSNGLLIVGIIFGLVFLFGIVMAVR